MERSTPTLMLRLLPAIALAALHSPAEVSYLPAHSPAGYARKAPAKKRNKFIAKQRARRCAR